MDNQARQKRRTRRVPFAMAMLAAVALPLPVGQALASAPNELAANHTYMQNHGNRDVHAEQHNLRVRSNLGSESDNRSHGDDSLWKPCGYDSFGVDSCE